MCACVFVDTNPCKTRNTDGKDRQDFRRMASFKGEGPEEMTVHRWPCPPWRFRGSQPAPWAADPEGLRCSPNLHLSLFSCPLWIQGETPPGCPLPFPPSPLSLSVREFCKYEARDCTPHPKSGWWTWSGGFGEYTSVKTTDSKSVSIMVKQMPLNLSV